MTDRQISVGEAPSVVPQEEKPQEQDRGIEQIQVESRISKKKQRRRITSYLSNISKQVEKNGNQINKITMTIQSLQKQGQSKTATGAVISQSHSQLIKQLQFKVSQLQKQVTRIRNDIQWIRTTATAAIIKSRSKKGKSIKSNKVKRHRRIR